MIILWLFPIKRNCSVYAQSRIIIVFPIISLADMTFSNAANSKFMTVPAEEHYPIQIFQNFMFLNV